MTYQHDVISHYLYAKEVIGSQNLPFFPQKKIRKKIYSRSNLKIAGFNTVMSYEVLQHILRLKDSPSIIVVVYSTRAQWAGGGIFQKVTLEYSLFFILHLN